MTKSARKSAIFGMALLAPVALIAQSSSPLWVDPAPGTYSIMPASGMCLERAGRGSLLVEPHVQIGACDSSLFFQDIEMAPVGRSGPVTATISSTTWRFMVGNECATVARNVVFGAPRVDMLRCDGDGPDRTFAGAADQKFLIERQGGLNIRIRTTDGRCWTSEGSNVRVSAKIMVEPCDGRAGQTFTLRQTDGVTEFINQDAAARFGWQRVEATDHDADRQFVLPRFNLPSGDYTSGLPTANDGGVECARLCVRDASCRGYTWVDPRNRGGTPMCYKKNQLNEPVADAMTNSGIIRPLG